MTRALLMFLVIGLPACADRASSPADADVFETDASDATDRDSSAPIFQADSGTDGAFVCPSAPPPCPKVAPKLGAACHWEDFQAGDLCEYGTASWPDCDDVFRCEYGTWTRPLPPNSACTGLCPMSEQGLAGTTCTSPSVCAFDAGICACPAKKAWGCDDSAAALQRPRAGTACSNDAGPIKIPLWSVGNCNNMVMYCECDTWVVSADCVVKGHPPW